MLRIRLSAAVAAVLFVALSEATVRPGTCPDPRVMRIACDGSRTVEGKDCTSDDSCSAGRKCCDSPCGWKECFVAGETDLPPPTYDYDGCPPHTMEMCEVDKPKLCNSTTTCGFGEKCCPVSCSGMQCMPAGQKEGQCEDPKRELADCMFNAWENSKADCAYDYQCGGNQKCCQQTCVKPLCKAPIKAGTCPMTIQGCPADQTISNKCTDDFDCKGDQKCCSSGCGLACMAPEGTVAAKPGECPMSIQGCPAGQTISNKCTADSDCTGDLKCCSSGCGLACMAPEGTVAVKKGECPMTIQGCPAGQTISNKCTADSDCKGDLKCCSSGCGLACMAPEGTAAVKPGQCPIHIMMCPAGEVSEVKNGCENDGQCSGTMKCCSTACNGLQCQEPQKEPAPDASKPGECKPVNWAAIQCLPMDDAAKSYQCSTDKECAGEAKCCDSPCTEKRCRLPAQCPYFDPRRACLVKNPSECTVGEKCANGRSCCEYECGGTRCEPELCPGVNPDIRCVVANEKACNSSDECGPDAICCSYECDGRKCVPRDTPAHSGFCPDYSGIKVKCPAVIPTDECSSDAQCSAGKKCCTKMCGGLGCIDTVSEQPPKPAAPVCPTYNKNADCTTRRGAYTCNPGGTCSNGGQCCNTECGGTSCQVALCPAPENIVCIKRETRDCETSATCGTGKVCCEIHCGGSRCKSPLGSSVAVDGGNPTDGRAVQGSPAPICPKPAANPSCPAAIRNRACNSDAECGSKRCCDSGCGVKVCQTPVRPGTCPNPTVRCMAPKPSDKANKCGTDMSCPGNQKCCPSPCPGFGASCMEPAA